MFRSDLVVRRLSLTSFLVLFNHPTCKFILNRMSSSQDKPRRPRPASSATSTHSATSAEKSVPPTPTSKSSHSSMQSQPVLVMDALDASRDSVSTYMSVPPSGGGGVSLLKGSGPRVSTSGPTGHGLALGPGMSAGLLGSLGIASASGHQTQENPMESSGHSSPPKDPVTTGSQTTCQSTGDAQPTFGQQLRKELEPGGVLADFMESMLSRMAASRPGSSTHPPQGGALGARADPNAEGMVGVESNHSQCNLSSMAPNPRGRAQGVTSASGHRPVASSGGSWVVPGRPSLPPTPEVVTSDREEVEMEGTSASDPEAGASSGSEQDQEARHPEVPSSLRQFMAKAIQLTRTVHPDGVVQASATQSSTTASALGWIGGSAWSQVDRFRASPAVVSSIKETFASLKGTSGPEATQTTSGLELPVGGKPHFRKAERTSGSGHAKFWVSNPGLHRKHLPSDLPPTLGTSSTRLPSSSSVEGRLRVLEDMALNLADAHASSDALQNALLRAMFGKSWEATEGTQTKPKFVPAVPDNVLSLFKALVYMHHLSLEQISNLMTNIVAWRREIALEKSSASVELQAKLVSAPYSSSGLFGESGTAAVPAHHTSTLNTALESLAKQRPQSSGSSSRKRPSSQRPTIPPLPPSKKSKSQGKGKSLAGPRKGRYPGPKSSAKVPPP